jgi:hypothetical protein
MSETKRPDPRAPASSARFPSSSRGGAGGEGVATRCLLLLVLVALFGLTAARVRAAGPITVTAAPSVQDKFPAELDFSISAEDSVPITDAVLHYTLLPSTSSVLARGDFQKGTSVQAQYRMLSNGNPLYLPPGKQIRYTWELTDQNGATLTTDPQTASFDDTRFQWKTATSGNLTFSYYSGTDAEAKSLLDVGRAAIDKAAQLEGTQVNFPIKLFAYASSQDFLPAAQKESAATDPGLHGQAQEPDTVLFWASSLQGSDTQDTVRHELTHLVTAQAVQGGFSGLLPLWLNEGASVYAQASPGEFGVAIQQAIDNDAVVPIQVLESSRGVDVGLFYGESWALVKYLIDTGGPPKFAQLLASIKTGKSIDQALQGAYGFDRSGLYNAWRDSVHLSGPSAAQSQTQSPQPQTGQQAAASSGNGPDANATVDSGPPPSRGSAQSTSSGSDSGTTILLLTLGGSLMLLLLAASIGLGLVLAQRSRGAGR